jgi:succinyl-diaminopimelate desuccinylase
VTIDADGSDLLALTAALVDIPSVSHDEARLAGEIDTWLARHAPALARTRSGNTVVARTERGHDRRIVLGGHLDTVPPDNNATARVGSDVCSGLGSADMKGGLAVMLRLANELSAADDATSDLTLLFYDCEEVDERHNGLRALFDEHAELVTGDLAILLEPTDGRIEAGCQGTLHLRATFEGRRAHSARPWMGENAIHRAAQTLTRLAEHTAQTVTVDGLEFRESLQVVSIDGGVAHNVVPDTCSIVVNRRFAPAVTPDEAEAQVRALLADADGIEVVNLSPAATPNLSDPLVAEAVDTLGGDVRPKLGWTDVARFAAQGIPALNFGPGDPTIAHTPDEHVTRASLEAVHAALGRLVTF